MVLHKAGLIEFNNKGGKMSFQSRYDTQKTVNIKIPWETNTARGFIISLALTILGLILAPFVEITPANPREMPINTIPVTLLNFGDGDGTGMSKGNLTPEGMTHKGQKPRSDLEDARIASVTKPGIAPDNSELTSNIKPANQLSSDQRNNTTTSGSDSRNIGSPDGSETGTGLGDKGLGKGKGSGFGDIEWGGGGNRTVIYKKIPQFPDGVNTSAQIKMKFTVLSDGTVGLVMPMQKADPRLERAAIEALRQWRFNPLKEDIVMVGIIPLNFMLR